MPAFLGQISFMFSGGRILSLSVRLNYVACQVQVQADDVENPRRFAQSRRFERLPGFKIKAEPVDSLIYSDVRVDSDSDVHGSSELARDFAQQPDFVFAVNVYQRSLRNRGEQVFSGFAGAVKNYRTARDPEFSRYVVFKSGGDLGPGSLLVDYLQNPRQVVRLVSVGDFGARVFFAEHPFECSDVVFERSGGYEKQRASVSFDKAVDVRGFDIPHNVTDCARRRISTGI